MSAARRTVRAGALALIGAVMLAGCAEPLPTPSPEPAPVMAPPVIDAVQESAILAGVGTVLEETEGELDADALSKRLSGPALTIRKSEIAVAKSLKSTDLMTVIPTEVEGIIVPTTLDWPRTAFAVSVQPELQTQRLLVLQQSSARAQYKLWAWVKLFPQIELKSFATSLTGSPEFAPDAPGLVMTPQEAVTNYADLLNEGKKSDFYEDFAPDRFREEIAKNNKLQNEALKAADGKQTMKFTPVDSAVYALGSVEGGALVVGELSATEDRIAEEGAQLSASTPVEQALTKKLDITNSMTIGFTTVVAIYIPPAGSTEAVTVVGVDHVATSADVPK